LTGGNLKLLTLAINDIKYADQLFQLDEYSIKKSVHRLYLFNKNLAYIHFMKKLCALSMFDITPLNDYIGETEEALASGIVSRSYRPNRYKFIHSTLAEVFFYVLLDMDEGPPKDWNKRILMALTDYLHYLRNKNHQQQIHSFLLNFSSSKLYFNEFNFNKILSGFLQSSEFKILLSDQSIIIRTLALKRLAAMASYQKVEGLNAINDAIIIQLKALCEKNDDLSEENLDDFFYGILGIRKFSPEHQREILVKKSKKC